MKPSFLFILFFSFLGTISAQDDLRTVKNDAFTYGESLRFRVHYGWVNAGFVSLDISKEPSIRGERKAYRVMGIGESTGAFDWFFKVRDRYETYIDEEMIAPLIFIRRINEGGYSLKQDYVFNHQAQTVYNGKVFLKSGEYVQDMISAFYFARCIDFKDAKGGEIYTIPTYVDDSLYFSKIKFVGREILQTDIGKFRCLVFRPVIQTGRIFKNEEDLNVWITDDENKIPLRAQANILVGSIKLDLTEYSGLKNPISIINK